MPRITWRFTAISSLTCLLFLTLACLAPFIGKAFYIDDTLFLRAAEQIQKHPADFYGFKINWFGDTTPMTEAFDNPPVTCYYIALVAAIAGWSEWAMHLAFLLPALAAVWGIFSLAKYYCDRPALAALLAVLTPVFLISGTTVMCDVMLLALWVWSLVLFERGLKENIPAAFLASGVLAGLAVLTKFTGLALLPLLGVYGLVRQTRVGWWIVTPLVPMLFAGGYEWYTHELYGRGLLLSAAGYASGYQYSKDHHFWEKEVIGLGFVGGCFLPLLFYAPFLWSRRGLLLGLGLVGVCTPLLYRVSYLQPFLMRSGWNLDWKMSLQSALFTVAGLQVLVLASIDFWQRRDPVSLLLVLWTWGIFVFAAAINWTVNGRSLLPMAPAIGILVARRIEGRKPGFQPGQFSLSLLWPALAAALISLLFVKADYNVASSQRAAAVEACARYIKPGNTLWFEGHWGFQYYMEKFGAVALEVKSPRSVAGDVLVIPNDASETHRAPPHFRLIKALKYLPNEHCTTMDLSAGIGFYAATFGPLPFAVVDELGDDRYFVYQAGN